MKSRDLADLLLLAALWGASFLFMRLGALEFGAVALAAVRVTGATLCLLPLLLSRRLGPVLRQHWKPIFAVGLLNSALPFVLYSYAALAISAGLSSIFNATTPLWGALVAWLWLHDRLDRMRVAGLVIGFAGVIWLAWDKASFRPGVDAPASGSAVLACLAATLLYGVAASFTKRHLSGVHPLATATGSQLASALVLAGPAWVWRPAAWPGTQAWLAAALLAVLCTGVAYVLYFRLIGNVGPANAMAVTFLIPAFAVLWGALFLGEIVGATMVGACLVILLGTALATGLVRAPVPHPR